MLLLVLLLPILSCAVLQLNSPFVQDVDLGYSSVNVHWLAPNDEGYPIDSYDLQYRIPFPSSNPWIPIVGAGLVSSKRAVQSITTRSDPGQVISQGTFRLQLEYEGMNSFNNDNLIPITITDQIPYDATAAQMTTFLEKLSDVFNIHVIRGYVGANGLIDGPNPSDGGYTWTVTFDWDILRGAKPLFVVVDSNFNAPYTSQAVKLGEVQCVEIWPLANNALSGTFTLSLNGVASSSIPINADGPTFQAAISTFAPDATVVRQYDHILSIPSYDSSIQRWCITWPFSDGNINTVVLSSWSSPNTGGSSVVTEYQGGTQFSGKGPVSVINVRVGSTAQMGCTGSCSYLVSNLQSGTFYQFKIRAHNSNGWSSFSGDSNVIKTLAIAPPSRPSAPILGSKTSSYLTIALNDDPTASTQANIVSYEVQFEANGNGIWKSLPHYVTSSYNQVTLDSLDGASMYRFRSRGINVAGVMSDWSGTSVFMSLAPSLPPPPSQPVVDPLSITDTSLTLNWLAPSVINTVSISSYILQSKQFTDVSWTTIDDKISGYASNSIREVQTILIRANVGETISGSDSFRLGLNYNGFNSFNTNEMTVTNYISATSTDAQLRAALEQLDPIRSLQRVYKGPIDAQGGCTFTIYFDPNLNLGDIPLLQVVSQNFANPYVGDGQGNVLIFEKQAGSQATPLLTFQYQVSNLVPYTRYSFRVQAVTETFGVTKWSKQSDFIRTTSSDIPMAFPVPTSTLNSFSVGSSIFNGLPANSIDPYYINGVGQGGGPNSDGQNGLIVMIFQIFSQEEVNTMTFYFTEQDSHGKSVFYTIPYRNFNGLSIEYVDIKAWGAGGGGGPNSNGIGGGGGFIQARIAVKPGDVLEVRVGQGGAAGKGNVGGIGGWNGGGNGGDGEVAAGGGGGASSVLRNNNVLVIAGGGAGAGSTQYCCAHGGGGGGYDGYIGASAADNTPRDNTNLAPRNEYHDSRDYHGMPAYEQNVDLGFAKDANLTVLSSPGAGGSSSNGGLGGVTGSFIQSSGQTFAVLSGQAYVEEIRGTFSTRDAVNGMQFQGGSGGSSKEGGGGGGGGYNGGGGGGGGFYGSGGGGGSSYFDQTSVWTPSDSELGLKQYPFQIMSLYVAFINYNTITLRWRPPTSSMGGEPRYYLLEMSRLSGNDDFQFIGMINAASGILEFTKTGLDSNIIYNFRICSVSHYGGASLWSAPIQTATMPLPANLWTRIYERWLEQAIPGGGLELVDPPTDSNRVTPSPRRGQSAVMIDGYMYMFGGLSEGYVCENGITALCHTNVDGTGTLLPNGTVYAASSNNELWRLDPVTWEWLLLSYIGGVPSPREMHSVSLFNGLMYMFGGRVDIEDNVGRNDLWVMNPDKISTSYAYSSGTNNNVPILDGKNSFSMINATIAPDRCLVDLKVHVSINHACTRDIVIYLYGPGPSALSYTWKYQKGDRDNRIKLFDHYDGTSTLACGVNLVNTVFDDLAPVDIGASSISPFTGSFRPVDKLSQYYEIPGSGQWTLQVYDRNVNGIQGTILNWNLEFTYGPCQRTYTWTNLTPSITTPLPPRRYGAKSIALNGIIYLFGGVSNYKLNDLWAYVVSENAWKSLSPILPPLNRYTGQSELISPWKILTFGGMMKNEYNSRVSLYDPIDHFFTNITTTGKEGYTSPHIYREPTPFYPAQFDPIPWNRYLASVVLTGNTGSDGAIRGVKEPIMIVFGGYDGSGQRYLGDLWTLSLRNINATYDETALNTLKQNQCSWRVANGTANTYWSQSCGITSASNVQTHACAVDDILTRAWCLNAYQSL